MALTTEFEESGRTAVLLNQRDELGHGAGGRVGVGVEVDASLQQTILYTILPFQQNARIVVVEEACNFVRCRHGSRMLCHGLCAFPEADLLRYRLFDAGGTAGIVGPAVRRCSIRQALARKGRHAVDGVGVVRAPVVVEAVGLEALVDEALPTDHGKEAFGGMEIAAFGVADDDAARVDGILFFRQGLCLTPLHSAYAVRVLVVEAQKGRQ